MQRAGQLAGKTLGQIAETLGLSVPADQRRAKGWVGGLMERYLGATATSLSEPDFQYIGVELKTLPVNYNGRPKESTYVCTVPLMELSALNWESSNVKQKLAKVLWVPVEADPSISLARRRAGSPFLWTPNPEQEAILRGDWEELMEMVCLGELDQISSRQGRYLQIRPKAANARSLTRTITETGEFGLTLPRGFYLRPAFTYSLLKGQTS